MTGNNQIAVEDVTWCDKLKNDQILALEGYFNAIEEQISLSGSSNALDDKALLDIYRILADKPPGEVKIDDAKKYFRAGKYPMTANDEQPGKL